MLPSHQGGPGSIPSLYMSVSISSLDEYDLGKISPYYLFFYLSFCSVECQDSNLLTWCVFLYKLKNLLWSFPHRKQLSVLGSNVNLVFKYDLKVLSNEKRGNLKVVAFDRFTFKLVTLRFSNKSVQAPSCERPRTAQRTLFL
jgi:hypothetical protein